MTILLETSRLILKAPTPDDLQDYINLYMNPGVRRLMYTRAKDATQVENWLNSSIQHQQQHGFCVGTVIEKATQQFVGRAGLAPIDPSADIQGIEVDCFLLPEYWRKHYGHELLTACFDWGLNQHHLPKILATVYPINIPAQKLAEKSGMRNIGKHKHKEIEFVWYEIISVHHT